MREKGRAIISLPPRNGVICSMTVCSGVMLTCSDFGRRQPPRQSLKGALGENLLEVTVAGLPIPERQSMAVRRF